jgi:hypothetical protein
VITSRKSSLLNIDQTGGLIVTKKSFRRFLHWLAMNEVPVVFYNFYRTMANTNSRTQYINTHFEQIFTNERHMGGSNPTLPSSINKAEKRSGNLPKLIADYFSNNKHKTYFLSTAFCFTELIYARLSPPLLVRCWVKSRNEHIPFRIFV